MIRWFKRIAPNLNLLLVAALIASLFTLLAPAQPVYAAGWLSGYDYRQEFELSHPEGALSDYVINITAHEGAG